MCFHGGRVVSVCSRARARVCCASLSGCVRAFVLVSSERCKDRVLRKECEKEGRMIFQPIPTHSQPIVAVGWIVETHGGFRWRPDAVIDFGGRLLHCRGRENHTKGIEEK